MFEKLLEKNASIDEAIKNFKPETTQERLQDIVKAVQFCIRENSKFLVPITNPDAEVGQEYMLRTTYNPEGKLYAVAFTNESEIEKGAETATILYDIQTFLNICLATERLEGLAFNPWGNSFYMPRSVIRLIYENIPDGDEDYVQDNARLNSAIYFATEKHAGQLRKTSNLPYILHPLDTMQILSTMKADGNLLIAGVLHDTVSTSDVSIDEIELSFGEDVAELIAGYTTDPELSWIDARNKEIENCKNGSSRLKMLVLADMVSTLRILHRDSLEMAEQVWSRLDAPKEKQSWFYSEIQEFLSELQDYKETAPVYWEMVDLYKYLFVTYLFDPQEKVLYQTSPHGEGYLFEKDQPGWKSFTGTLPEAAVVISKYDAEKLEETWSLLKTNE